MNDVFAELAWLETSLKQDGVPDWLVQMAKERWMADRPDPTSLIPILWADRLLKVLEKRAVPGDVPAAGE